MDKSLESKVVRSARNSDSLRITIPQVVAQTLDLKPGDTLNWSISGPSDAIQVSKSTRRK
ncbi:MAG TPA: AbrB/MazE/SpoVT family DNA-binding domain-containing protein [Thermoplasmata archaeon]|nr:AbrB/MazE/SpoVT family DNA-binding domain-containing protein [Thermoplasmata archaeon]